MHRSGAKSSMLAYGFFHLWLALVMILLRDYGELALSTKLVLYEM